MFDQYNNSYLFSLALCLKSSMAFINRVTLNSPLSLSSNRRLEERTGTCYTAVMILINRRLSQSIQSIQVTNHPLKMHVLVIDVF